MSLVGAERLQEALDRQIDYFATEYDMSNAEIVGVLEMVKFNVLYEEVDDDDEEA